MNPVLTVERVVSADPSRVWTAWTTADGLAAWWWPHLPGTSYEIDARVGGTYRIYSAGAGFGVRGEFDQVTEPHRLGASWIWIDDDDDGPLEHIDITFSDHPSGTRIVVVHTGPWTTGEPLEAYRQGWTDTLAALAALDVVH